MYKRVAIALVVLGLAACGAPRPRPPAPQTPNQPTPRLQPLPAPGTYRIDSEQLGAARVGVSGGSAGELGHNHVMVNRALSGTVQIGATWQASSFSISVPVGDFIVDDAQARFEEGGDFPGEIPEDAKAGTLSQHAERHAAQRRAVPGNHREEHGDHRHARARSAPH